LSKNKERFDKCPKDYVKWTIVTAGMVFAFFAYLIYSYITGFDIDEVSVSGLVGEISGPVTSGSIVRTATVKNTSVLPSAFLGLEIVSVNEVIAEQLGIPDGHGVLVNSVIGDSPAEKAGLQRGDVIAVINATATRDVDIFKEVMTTLEPNETVRITYVRDGRKSRTYATLAELPPTMLTAQTTNTDTDVTDDSDWGVSLSAITSTLRDTYNIPNNVDGVVIVSVVPGGAAAKAGLGPGDVVVGIDGTSISDIYDFLNTVASDEDDTAIIDIYTQGQFRYIPIASIETDDSICGTNESIPVEQLPAYEGLLRAVPLVGVAGLGFALLGYFCLFGYPAGNEKMQAIAEKIRSGTVVFLKQEYKITAIFLVISFLAICFTLCLPTAIAFLAGSICSILPGWIGMKAATTANSRTCQAAKKSGLRKALNVAFLGGSVMGISVASVGIIGLGTYSLLVLNGNNPETLPYIVAGFCLGASFFALFGRVGGGIFTKSADIGADMTGKIEYNLPEDDPRNPAVIADNVGDNVGDVAGMGSDLFESYTSSTVATIIMALRMGELKYVILPLVLIAIGLICSLLSIAVSKFISRHAGPQSFLRNVIYIANGLFLVGALVAVVCITGEFSLFVSVAMGVLCGLLIGFGTEYFGSGLPIRYVVEMSKTGPATNIIAGLAVGFIGALLPIITICATIIITLFLTGLYGIGLSAVAMLSTMAIIMSIDAYGPIVDNAGGIATMSRAGVKTRRITDKLDTAGNITAAIGKGFTIGAGVITTVALFAAYIGGTKLAHAELFTPAVLVGLFIGAALPLFFAAWTMGAVTRIANKLVFEVRRQFKEIKGILTGKAEPDTDRCVEIIAHDSLMATVVAGIVAIASPFVVSFTLGVEALGGFLVGAMIVGSVLGLSMSIGGSTWDNAKKWIESRREKGDDMEATYKAAVVGDMVGDPFKDVSGPAMNILIKLMVTISLVFCAVLCSV
jgi:K(+)-stimulated pyrophosphate-energized sodium pump